MSTERFLILGARRYSFQDGDRTVSGMQISYVEPMDAGDSNRVGNAAMTIDGSPEIWPQLEKSPGVFDVQLSRRPGRGGKPATVITSAKLVKPVELEKMLAQ